MILWYFYPVYFKENFFVKFEFNKKGFGLCNVEGNFEKSQLPN